MKFKIWLIMLKVNETVKLKLLDLCDDEEDIYNNFDEILRLTPSMKKRLPNYNKILELNESEKVVKWMEKNKVGFLSINDENYPESLRHLKDAPYGIFYKGNEKLLRGRNVGIVGSRTCTNYGCEVTKLLTKELITYNITIISGGAKGIDSVAHNTCITNEGNTICVLGCGIDVVYPAQNRRLFKQIEEQGVIISEFLPGEKPYHYNFPRRNRIISGLSELVIVVEATEKSGSLITASYAADQGKDVLAIPGSIFSKGSVGCNKLIKDGAIMFTSLSDLHQALKLNKNINSRIISPIKQKILSLVSNEPVHIDIIINKSHIDRDALFKVLFEMQIRNEIVSLPGNYYAKIT